MKKLLSILTIALLFVCGKCAEDDDVKVELPDNILAYLQANYNGYELEEAELDSLCTGSSVYEVEIEVNDDEEIELIFDTEGSLLYTESEINANQLPAAVSNSISTNYSTYSIDEVDQLTAPSGDILYEVEVKNGSDVLSVMVTADGTVLCQEVEDDDDDE
jgi:uncharacterized membrane protein YkoI